MAKKKQFSINFATANPKAKNAYAAPVVQTTLEQKDIPLGFKNPTLEQESNEEVEFIRTKFKEQAKAEATARGDYMNDDYYSCIVFSNAEQREAFFKGLGIETEGGNLRFVNGLQLAAHLNVKLPPASKMPPPKFRMLKEILSLCFLPRSK